MEPSPFIAQLIRFNHLDVHNDEHKHKVQELVLEKYKKPQTVDKLLRKSFKYSYSSGKNTGKAHTGLEPNGLQRGENGAVYTDKDLYNDTHPHQIPSRGGGFIGGEIEGLKIPVTPTHLEEYALEHRPAHPHALKNPRTKYYPKDKPPPNIMLPFHQQKADEKMNAYLQTPSTSHGGLLRAFETGNDPPLIPKWLVQLPEEYVTHICEIKEVLTNVKDPAYPIGELLALADIVRNKMKLTMITKQEICDVLRKIPESYSAASKPGLSFGHFMLALGNPELAEKLKIFKAVPRKFIWEEYDEGGDEGDEEEDDGGTEEEEEEEFPPSGHGSRSRHHHHHHHHHGHHHHKSHNSLHHKSTSNTRQTHDQHQHHHGHHNHHKSHHSLHHTHPHHQHHRHLDSRHPYGHMHGRHYDALVYFLERNDPEAKSKAATDSMNANANESQGQGRDKDRVTIKQPGSEGTEGEREEQHKARHLLREQIFFSGLLTIQMYETLENVNKLLSAKEAIPPAKSYDQMYKEAESIGVKKLGKAEWEIHRHRPPKISPYLTPVPLCLPRLQIHVPSAEDKHTMSERVKVKFMHYAVHAPPANNLAGPFKLTENRERIRMALKYLASKGDCLAMLPDFRYMLHFGDANVHMTKEIYKPPKKEIPLRPIHSRMKSRYEDSDDLRWIWHESRKQYVPAILPISLVRRVQGRALQVEANKIQDKSWAEMERRRDQFRHDLWRRLDVLNVPDGRTRNNFVYAYESLIPEYHHLSVVNFKPRHPAHVYHF